MLTATVLVVCALALVSVATPTDKPYYDLEQAEQHFEQFMRTHGKTYADEQEKRKRFEIFKKSLSQINQLNAREDLAVFDIQSYSDLSKDEMMGRYIIYKPPTTYNELPTCNQTSGEEFLNKDPIPDQFDWRDKKFVTRVKDQKNCGSCWAFATTGVLEGQYAKKNKKLIEFSEQQLIDCYEFGFPCLSGKITLGSLYLTKHGAISEAEYPYTGENIAKCHDNSAKVYVNVSGCFNFTTTDEEQLKALLFKTGPVGVVIDGNDLFLYKQGIVKKCSYYYGNQHLLLVGYGVDNGVPYWTLKNSWSEKYGEKGYIRLQRGTNTCGIMNGEKITMKL